MRKVIAKTTKLIHYNTESTDEFWFWCDGCCSHHVFYTRHPDGPEWEWNGSMEYPTFSPSLRLDRCHLIMKDGTIYYCGDSNHFLANYCVYMSEAPACKELEPLTREQCEAL